MSDKFYYLFSVAMEVSLYGEQTGLREFGTSSHVVANNPRARLMYYLNCVTTVLQLDDPYIHRLADDDHYYNLSEQEEAIMLLLILKFSPDELDGKVFFHSDELCKNSGNNFYEINRVKHIFALRENVVIGGKSSTVLKIMTYKRHWMVKNYFEPLIAFKRILEEREAARKAQSCTCSIL